MDRIGVIGIVIIGDFEASVEVQQILHSYRDIIVGRMGVPMREQRLAAISLIVKGSNEAISALTGKLGRIEDINVKSALLASDITE